MFAVYLKVEKKKESRFQKHYLKKKKIIHVWLTKIHIFYFYLYFLLHVQYHITTLSNFILKIVWLTNQTESNL